MNVTFVTESLNQYRMGWFDHLSSLAEPRVSVVFMRVEVDRPWDAYVADSAPATRIPATNVPIPGYGRATIVRSLDACLGNSEPDLVVIPGWGQVASYQVVSWCLRRRIPYAVLFETWSPQRVLKLPPPLTARLRRWVLGKAELRLPISLRALSFVQSLGFDGNVVHANVCDVEDAARHGNGQARGADGAFRVIYCGRLVESKGVGLLLDTIESCRTDSRKIRFVIMGSGPLEPRLRQVQASTGLIEYLGPVSGADRFSYIAGADALLLPSRVEPWGVVVHEALAVGTPVVVSHHVGCIPEFVENTGAGVICDTEVDALKEGMCDLLSQAGRDRDLSDTCRRAARCHTYATATTELFEALAM